MKQAAPPNNRKGGWIGIDLGTSNCTAAVWDLERSRCKVLRLGFKNLARPPPDGNKSGKIVPSAVLFTGDDGDDKVGFDAISHLRADGSSNNDNAECDTSDALVTSFKRVVGMTSRQAKELQLADEYFWNSLPFQAVIMDDEENNEVHKAEQSDDGLNSSQDVAFDVLGDINYVTHAQSTPQQTGKKEGVAIRIRTLKSKRERLVTPLDVTTTLLRSIRVAANEYLTVGKNRSKIVAPGMSPDCDTTTNTQPLISCIIGVPAHYSVVQRKYIQIAAKEAGFSGYVGVMTESTAAAMAYGLFVSPNVTSTSSTDDEGKTILVFDMGGGTTDVTIAKMDSGKSDTVKFRVLATAGDRCLGGDNVDELLARFVWKRIDSSSDVKSSWKASEHQELVRQCRCAKEELCGSDDTDSSGDVTIAYLGKELQITRTDFDQAIQHLVDRAEHVIDEALSALKLQASTTNIHEVVLVGGSTYIPAIRTMLRRKFPPPVPPELCTSISAETAVSQGLAIQAALVSGLVPLFELRNAMMLDTIPHSIGVWVSNTANQAPPYEAGDFIEAKDKGAIAGHFVPILEKDTTLPAKGSTTFELANADQHGVSIVAVEHIGQDQYQCMGVFNFLLHRVEDCDNKRKIEVGMVLKESGQFVVSIFDEKDPEHREKGRKYLESKGLTDYELEEKEVPSYSGNEIGLILFCVAFFALYVAVKVLFNDVELVDNEL
jgi:molecular chaperone DnaK (HSP70)